MSLPLTRPLQPDDRVIWLHQLRGGYSYTELIPITVVKLSAKRVQVEAPLKNSGTKRVSVNPANLRQP
jgi:hypothetical protein